MNIIKNIIEIRKQKGINQDVIADALNVDVSAISNIEKGKRELKVSELGKIAKVLNVDLLYLFTYPDIYEKKGNGVKDAEPAKTKILVEVDVNADEFIQMGLKDKVKKVLNN
jgi:transcriptional regulator with XRE-family HTH domain